MRPPRKRSRVKGGKGGRPKADPEKVRAALELVDNGSATPEEAAVMVGIGGNTVRRAMKARGEGSGEEVEVEARPADVAPALDVEALTLPEGVADLVLSSPDPAKVASIRAMVVRGKVETTGEDGKTEGVPVELGADFVERIATGEGCTPREVRLLLLAAAVESRLDALPRELAMERSIAAGERAAKNAADANDWKSQLLAQQHVDRVRFGKREPDPEGLTRAEVVILLRRIAGALRGVPGGAEALRQALSEE